jgi:hypothetical protein
MRGLDPRIHVDPRLRSKSWLLVLYARQRNMDCRVKPGNDAPRNASVERKQL